MASPLDDASQPAPVRLLPLLALVVGLVSGPVACGLAAFSTANQLPQPTKEALAFYSLVGVFGSAFLFALVVRVVFAGTRRGRLFASAGVAATGVWALLIFGFIMYALSRV